jgi:hypothetical protein
MGHEFAVGGSCGGEFLVAFLELQPQVGDLLFEEGYLLFEPLDVLGRAELRLATGLFAEKFG